MSEIELVKSEEKADIINILWGLDLVVVFVFGFCCVCCFSWHNVTQKLLRPLRRRFRGTLVDLVNVADLEKGKTSYRRFVCKGEAIRRRIKKALKLRRRFFRVYNSFCLFPINGENMFWGSWRFASDQSSFLAVVQLLIAIDRH